MPDQPPQLTWFNKDRALIPTAQGAYGYTWVDPDDPRYHQIHFVVIDDVVEGLQSPVVAGRDYSELSQLEPQSDNLLIHGEATQVLRSLCGIPELAEKYLGAVKCVYLDPPFNTALNFEHYDDHLEHFIWLSMISECLRQLNRLMSDDGSIWVHLDSTENHRARVLLDEIFGAKRFIAEITWKKRGNLPNDRPLASNTDVILVYGSDQGFHLRPRPHGHGGYDNPDHDPRGPWTTHPVDANAKGGRNVDHLRYGITNPVTGQQYFPAPGRNWVYSQHEMEERISQGTVIFGKTGRSGPVKKAYLSQTRAGLTWPTLWLSDDISGFSYNNAADHHMQSMFPGEVPFDTPKPEELLQRIIQIATNPGDIVLDAFAGTGTTAAVAQKMGRRWVSCELRDQTFHHFTVPRLTNVVHDHDPGGITTTPGTPTPTHPDDFPTGISADEAQIFTKVLNRLASHDHQLKASPLVKQLKSAAKTTATRPIYNWRGGGGFRVGHLE